MSDRTFALRPEERGHHADQAAGLRRLFGAPVATFAVAAREDAVIDAYALIKRLVREEGGSCFRIAIAQAKSESEARTLFDAMQRVAHEYLGVRLEYAGRACLPPGESML